MPWFKFQVIAVFKTCRPAGNWKSNRAYGPQGNQGPIARGPNGAIDGLMSNQMASADVIDRVSQGLVPGRPLI